MRQAIDSAIGSAVILGAIVLTCCPVGAPKPTSDPLHACSNLGRVHTEGCQICRYAGPPLPDEIDGRNVRFTLPSEPRPAPWLTTAEAPPFQDEIEPTQTP